MTAEEILTLEDHFEADRLAGEIGVSAKELMESAGRGVAVEIISRWKPCPVSVICGPGNNGGDGFVVARILNNEGWPVRVALDGEASSLSDDAALMANLWTGPVEPLSPAIVQGAELIIDALYGAGLSRPISGIASEIINTVARLKIPVVAIDLPSGIFGDTGAAGKAVAPATLTVSFFKHKPAHLLYPARDLCGDIVIIDIGTPTSVLEEIKPNSWINTPELWDSSFPLLSSRSHKYERGHAVIISGGLSNTGAARLAAESAMRSGAGLTTIACPTESLSVIAPTLSEVLLVPSDSPSDLFDLLTLRKRNAVLIGPGNGVSDETRANVKTVLDAPVAVVIDADALTVFEDAPEELFRELDETCVLTPHDGEFDRIFPNVEDVGRLARARFAAEISGAVIVLKGPDTVVAHPDGRAAICNIAPPQLATAGSGDVLGGILIGLRAQGVPPFEASAIAVWLHARAALNFGPGLIASDLPSQIPSILRYLQDKYMRLGANYFSP